MIMIMIMIELKMLAVMLLMSTFYYLALV
jgi:hypothetical protein